jgi:hypothetical protein
MSHKFIGNQQAIVMLINVNISELDVSGHYGNSFTGECVRLSQLIGKYFSKWEIGYKLETKAMNA